MKFHWADFLEREGGHWQIVPNDERGKYWIDDCERLPSNTKIVTVTGETKNLHVLCGLEGLEELTLHETNQDQIDALGEFRQIKRLRITHARPKTMGVLAGLENVEELVLEYVSGFDDISPVAEMPKLRSLHVENLRKIRDFGPLGRAKGLRYLSVNGTFDWAQPIESMEFAASLNALEFLGLFARIGDMESVKALTALGDNCSFRFADNLLPLELFAYLEAKCAAATFEPVSYWYRSRPMPMSEDDPRLKLSPSEIEANHPEAYIMDDGRRMFFEPSEWDVYHLLGRGARDISVKTKNAAEKAEAYEKKYHDLVAAARP